MKREFNIYEMYLASVYKWGMTVLICACMCADFVYTSLKIAGLYPTVAWKGLICFDIMDAVFAVIAYFIVKTSIKDGYVSKEKQKVGKIFAFFVLLVQWNFILYLIPSRNFWGLLSFFIVLICFFLDLKMIWFFGMGLIFSLFIAWFIKGENLLPDKDELFVADLIVCTIAMFLILIGILIFVYFMTHLQWLRKLDEKHLKVQKKYYQQLLEKDEGMRRFRHDVKKHIYALDALCKGESLADVQVYISELLQEIQDHAGIYTGNQIADCFLNMAIQELEATGKVDYEIVGNFPDKMNVNNSDFCVLFANAVENAKEALEKIKGERKLFIVIKNYQGKVYIELKNNVNTEYESEEESGYSHGYGLKNMKLVVEKYGGSIYWEQKGEFFELNILI